MKILKDLGMVFPNENSKRKRNMAIFECTECKNEVKAQKAHVIKNNQKTCKSCARTIHGMNKNKHYGRYCKMIARCYDKDNKNFPRYGGRGISVCDSWRYDILEFIKWAENTYVEGNTLDRENNDGNYTPENCRWVSHLVQAQNTRVLTSSNTSGYRGVSIQDRKNPYRATIIVNYKKINLGSYATALEAAKAYDKYVIDNNLEHNINGVEQL